MTSALWYYMTPQFPKPSAHDVITGIFEPNDDVDKKNNVGHDFGTTIDIMAQDKTDQTTDECNIGGNVDTDEAI